MASTGEENPSGGGDLSGDPISLIMIGWLLVQRLLHSLYNYLSSSLYVAKVGLCKLHVRGYMDPLFEYSYRFGPIRVADCKLLYL
jgi:hypothetical protein